MEDEISLAFYTLLCMIGILFVSSSAYIISIIYEAPPISKRSSKVFKDSLRYRNCFLLALAAFNIFRAYTLYITGATRGSCAKDNNDKIYAGVSLSKDSANLLFASVFSLITLFFARLNKEQVNPRLFRYVFIAILVGLLVYVFIFMWYVIDSSKPMNYEYANSAVIIVVFLVMMFITVFYGIGLAVQVRKAENSLKSGGELVVDKLSDNGNDDNSEKLSTRVFFQY